MKPTPFALSLCLLAAACASPEPQAQVSKAATPDMSGAACTADAQGCVTPMTRADAVAADRSNGLGEAAFRLMLKFW